jgi:hypothetical protein
MAGFDAVHPFWLHDQLPPGQFTGILTESAHSRHDALHASREAYAETIMVSMQGPYAPCADEVRRDAWHSLCKVLTLAPSELARAKPSATRPDIVRKT